MDPPLATPVLFYALVLCSLPDFERTLLCRDFEKALGNIQMGGEVGEMAEFAAFAS